MATRILMRRGTAVEWATENPVLADGEIGYDRTNKIIKFGDGTTVWSVLPAYMLPEVDERLAAKATEIDNALAAQSAQVTSSVNAQVPPLVQTALSTDTVVVASVNTAIDDRVAGLDIALRTDSGMPLTTDASDKEVLVSILDADDYRTWLEARVSDGGPTDHAEALLREKIPGLPIEGSTEAGILISITDSERYRTWLEVNDVDGGPTPFSVDILKEVLNLPDPEVVNYVADGDSMTQGSGTTGDNSYPSYLAVLIGKPVINLGRSGTRAKDIALRAGAIVPMVTLPSPTLPGGTAAITVTIEGGTTGWSMGVEGTQPNRVTYGTIRGIPFTLTHNFSTGEWTLARITAGAEIPIASPVSFIPDEPYAGDTHILWSGRNNYPKVDAYDVIVANVLRFEEVGGKCLLLNVCNSSSEPAGSSGHTEITNLNATLHTRFPREYVDLRGRWIREGLGYAGLTATQEDLDDIAVDKIPRSLLKADGLHPNNPGYRAIAHIVQDELQIRGWL